MNIEFLDSLKNIDTTQLQPQDAAFIKAFFNRACCDTPHASQHLMRYIAARLNAIQRAIESKPTPKQTPERRTVFLPELDYWIYSGFARGEFRIGSKHERMTKTARIQNRIAWANPRAKPPGQGWFGYAIRDLEADTYELLVAREQLALDLAPYGHAVHAQNDCRYLGTTVHSVANFMRGNPDEENCLGTICLLRFNLKGTAIPASTLNASLVDPDNDPKRIVSSDEMRRVAERLQHSPPYEWPLQWAVTHPSSEFNPDLQPLKIALA